MRSLAAALLLFAFSSSSVAYAPDQSDAPLLGFTAAGSQTERQWEAKFRDLPDPAHMRASMKLLSARPHHVGSPYDKQNAEWIRDQLKEWGWDANIETFEVLFPTPKERLLEMVSPTPFKAKLEEPALSVDPTSSQKDEQLPTYNAYSIDGDVTAPLVFVNYGLPEDYEQLERLGVSVKGAIVIAKYGHSWRGIKPKVAAEHGAIGCIIYSDPQDDGYFQDEVFPQGPMRPKEGVQRGSVMDFSSNNPGDPLTPGYVAGPDKKRLSIKEAGSITKIPTLPISYGDAQPLLAALQGPVAPEQWRGSLPLTYHVGPGPAKVHLRVQFNWDIKPLYDVIAKMPGSVAPDQWVVRGNHHDAWVNGAEDPISGQMVLLEEARALGELHKQGWNPARTIIYCAWDGEEPMLLGSTEWAEAHADELRQHAVAYVNTDGNGRGFLYAEGSHSLESLVNEVAKDVPDPETKMSVWERARLQRISDAKPKDRKEIREREDLRIGPLGSGTDYTAFVDHLGVASLNLSFGGEDDGGIYHSIYDDFYWYTHFSDRDFVYGRALAQTVGGVVMRLADADVAPYRFTNLADTVEKYISQLKDLLKDKQDEIAERNLELSEGVFTAINDPRRPTVAPKKEEVPPHLNFAPLENASDQLTRSAKRYDAAISAALRSGALSPAAREQINSKLITAERQLTDPKGLLRRPYYKHLLYAPGVYTGYGPKTMAGVREGIEQKRYTEAESEGQRIAEALLREAKLLDSISAGLEESQPASSASGN